MIQAIKVVGFIEDEGGSKVCMRFLGKRGGRLLFINRWLLN